MRQVIVSLSLIGSFMVLALTIDLFDSLVMFLLFGILPGRVDPLSANQMLGIYATASVLVGGYALRPAVGNLFRPAPNRQTRGSAS